MSDESKPFGEIYMVTDIQEPHRVRYAGLTTRGLRERSSGHWTESRNGTLPINRFLKKRAGRKSDVAFTVIDTADNLEELNQKEVEWIAFFRSIGYADLNITDGGGGTKGRKMSQEEKERKRQAMIGVFRGDKHRGVVKLSWALVREIRERASASWEPHAQLATEYGVSQDVISGVIANTRWRDKSYDPATAKSRPPESHANNRQIEESVVKEIRELRMREWVPEMEIARRYNLTRSNVNNILRNHRWPDPNYDPARLVLAGGNGNGSKLTEADVVVIRSRVAAGETQSRVGQDYGIKQTQVSRIVRGVRWGHVKEGL